MKYRDNEICVIWSWEFGENETSEVKIWRFKYLWHDSVIWRYLCGWLREENFGKFLPVTDLYQIFSFELSAQFLFLLAFLLMMIHKPRLHFPFIEKQKSLKFPINFHLNFNFFARYRTFGIFPLIFLSNVIFSSFHRFN